jgi:hypothetical protein
MTTRVGILMAAHRRLHHPLTTRTITMSKVIASVLLGTQEVSALASALQGLLGLVANVAQAAPQVWAGVKDEFDHAKAAFHLESIALTGQHAAGAQALVDAGQQYASAGEHIQASSEPPAPEVVPAPVQAQVERSGQLPGMPVELFPNNPPATPAAPAATDSASEIAALEAQLAALKAAQAPRITD